jgi:hypothetical protein
MTNFVDVFGDYSVPPSERAYSAVTLTQNSVLAWPELSALSAENQFFATSILELSAESADLRIRLPPAQQVSLGKDILLLNTGALLIQIDSSDGSNVTSLSPGTAKYVFTKDAASNAWGVFTYGTGTSGADAAELAGSGLTPVDNELQLFAQYTPINSSRALDFVADRFCTIDVTAAGVELTLDNATTQPAQGFIALVRNSSTGTATLISLVGQNIDGAASKLLNPQESCILLQASNGWVTVGYSRDIEFAFSEVIVDITAGNITLASSDLIGRMIKVVGSPVAQRTIFLPAVNNIYFVNVTSSVGVADVLFQVGATTAVAVAANQSTALYVDGIRVFPAVTTALSAPLDLLDGSAASPTLKFLNDPDTGIFRKGNNQLGISTGGIERFVVTTTGVSVVGTIDCGTLS